MSERLAIPIDLFNDGAFLGLTLGDREFLLHLYRAFCDCETFRPDAEVLAEVDGVAPGDWRHKVTRLAEAGLLVIVNKIKTGKAGAPARVFQFKHKAIAA